MGNAHARFPAVIAGVPPAVWPLGVHPVNKNELIVWDLAMDPAELLTLNAAEIRLRLFGKPEELAEGQARLPIKTLHINKSPVVISSLKTLQPEMAERWGVDVAQALRHAERAAGFGGVLDGLWGEVFARPAPAQSPDVDEDLYGGFVGQNDRRTLQRLRALSPEKLADKRVAFEDSRLEELLFRYRARNFPDTLDEAQRAMKHLREAFNPRGNLSPDKMLPTAGGCGMEQKHPGRRAAL